MNGGKGREREGERGREIKRGGGGVDYRCEWERESKVYL
jgi:hypothetical protein